MRDLLIERIEGNFSICRFDPGVAIDVSAVSGFLSFTRTDEEVSIVCESSDPISADRREDGWTLLRVRGPIDFNEVGVLACIADTLAAAGISLFAISTFDTDYILVRETRLRDSLVALRESGIEVVE